MNTNLSKAFEEEFLSFFALYMMNLVFAAMTMAIGLAAVVQQLIPQPGTLPAEVAISSPVSLILGGAAFVIGLVWITATAKLLKSVRVVRKAYRQKKKREMSPEDFTGMMVQMMTQYREQKQMIRAMVVICMAGGYVLLVQGILSAIMIIERVIGGNAMFPIFLAILAVVFVVIMGGAGILISRYFRHYAKVWDTRLEALGRSEDELKRMLERT